LDIENRRPHRRATMEDAMNRSFRFAVAGLVVATSSFIGAGCVSAQTATGASPSAVTQGTSGMPPSGGEPGGHPTEGNPRPILLVTSVEVLRSERAGGMDIVRARGWVTSSAWDSPHLIAINKGEPVDGTLDLMYVGVSPATPEGLGPFMRVEAILAIENGHHYKAVRVRSGTNAITLDHMPGQSKILPPGIDCAKCLGKYFQAKGAAPPAGAAPADVVREEDLPYTLRIIRPTDGIPRYFLDPNRLTLVLGEDGRITDAAWD
jgi:hypothetical protein